MPSTSTRPRKSRRKRLPHGSRSTPAEEPQLAMGFTSPINKTTDFAALEARWQEMLAPARRMSKTNAKPVNFQLTQSFFQDTAKRFPPPSSQPNRCFLGLLTHARFAICSIKTCFSPKFALASLDQRRSEPLPLHEGLLKSIHGPDRLNHPLPCTEV